jgi:surface protein
MPRFIFIPSGVVVNNDFTFTVKTDNAGTSTSTQFKLPLVSSFNGITSNVDWGDGTTDSITAFDQSEVTHTYSTAGTYEIKISDALRSFRFDNSDDKLKILNISNWGVFTFNEISMFSGCSNLNTTSSDAPIITLTDASSTFRLCTSLTSLNVSNWDVSNIQSMFVMFFGCNSLTTLDVGNWDVSGVDNMWAIFRNSNLLSTVDVTNWDVGSVTNMREMLFNCDAFDYSLANWNIINVTNFSNFMRNATGLSISNYDATLIGWEATLQATYPSGTGYTPTISIDFGGSQYTSGGTADTARQSLVTNFGWTITDGGGI